MAAIQPLCRLLGVDLEGISKEEQVILEIKLFSSICKNLKEFFREQYKSYFYTFKFDNEKENNMIEDNFIHLIIKDIIATGEYTVDGIVHYTNTPKEAILDIILERNKNPSSIILQKILELHQTVRPDLYKTILKKIVLSYNVG